MSEKGTRPNQDLCGFGVNGVWPTPRRAYKSQILASYYLRTSPLDASGPSDARRVGGAREAITIIVIKNLWRTRIALHKNSLHRNSVHNNTKLITKTTKLITKYTKLITTSSKLVTNNTKLIILYQLHSLLDTFFIIYILYYINHSTSLV